MGRGRGATAPTEARLGQARLGQLARRKFFFRRLGYPSHHHRITTYMANTTATNTFTAIVAKNASFPTGDTDAANLATALAKSITTNKTLHGSNVQTDNAIQTRECALQVDVVRPAGRSGGVQSHKIAELVRRVATDMDHPTSTQSNLKLVYVRLEFDATNSNV